MADEGTTGFYLPRDTYNRFQADQFEQQARGQVADAWEQQARAAAPDLAAYHEQQVAQEQQRASERASYQASQDSAAQAGFQQAQQEAAQQEAAQQQQQQTQQNEQAAQQFGAQAWDQAATAATGVAPVRTQAPPTAPVPQAAPVVPSVTTSAPAPAPAPAPTSSAMPSASAGNYVAYAWQAAQKAGFDPATFVKQIQQESGFQPFNADGSPKRSGAGAIGIAQFMPGTAQGLGIDPTNPLAALDAAAKLMASYFQKYGGDTAKALAAYNAGPGNVDKFGGVPPFEETQTYVKNILGDVAGLGQQLTERAKQGVGDIGQVAQDTGTGAARVVTSAINNVIENLRPSQFGVGLDNAAAYAACGPVAALAFARAVGRNPTIQEAMQLAKGVGWSAAQGMAGPASELSLLKGLGVTSHMEQGADPNKIAQDVQNGNPVIISTPGHYFVADGFDPQRGAFHVGTSGTDLRAGSEWMTLGQMQQVMGQAQATLYLDRQPGDGPSVASQMSQGGTGPLTMGVMQLGDQQAASATQPTPSSGGGGFDPFGAVKNIAGAVGSGLNTLFGGGQQQTPPLLGGIGASVQTPSALSLPGATPANANLEAFGTQSPSQALPFGGRTAADLITGPLGALAQSAPAQAAGQAASDLYANPLRQELMPNILEPGHPFNVMADLQEKYAPGGVLPPDPDIMTPEDRQRYSQAQLAVGGMTMPLNPAGGKLPIRPPTSVAELPPLTPTAVQPERAANILLEKFPSEVRPFLQDAAAQFDNFLTQRRGVISDPQAAENAAKVALGTTPEQWIKTPAGKAFNQEQAAALGNTLSQVGQEYDAMLTTVRSARTAGTVTAEQESQLADKALQFASLAGVRSGAAAEAGRALRAFRTTLEGGEYATDRSKAIDQAFKAIGTDKERFAQWVEDFSKLPTDDAVGRYKMLQVLHTPSAWDKLSAWRYASMLSSWYTHLNNVGSNVVQSLARPAELAGGGYFGEAAADVRAMVDAIPKGAGAFMNTLRTGVSGERLSQFENIRPRPLGESLPARAITLPTDLMAAADDFFRTINTAGALNSAAVREAGGDSAKLAKLLVDPPAELINEAKQAARESTFQQDPGRWVNNLLQLRNTPGPGGMITQFFLPFVRTPANIFRAGAELTAQPFAGPVKITRALGRGDVRTARLEAGKTAFSSALGLTLAAKAANGELSGDGPTDPAKRRLLESQGWQRNSVKVGDQWISYMNFGPVAVPMAVVGNGWEQAQERGRLSPDDAGAIAAGVTVGILKSLSDASFLQQVGNTVKLMSGDTEAASFLQQTAAGAAGSLIPFGSALASAAQAGDVTAREPTKGAPFLQGLGERMAGRIPGLRQNEPEALDVLGRPQPGMAATDPVALAVRASRSRPDEMLATLSRAGVAVAEPPAEVTINDLQFKLQPEEQRSYRQAEGVYLQKALATISASDKFRAAPIEMQQEILKQQIRDARDYASMTVAKAIPHDALVQRITEYRGLQGARKQPLPIP